MLELHKLEQESEKGKKKKKFKGKKTAKVVWEVMVSIWCYKDWLSCKDLW